MTCENCANAKNIIKELLRTRNLIPHQICDEKECGVCWHKRTLFERAEAFVEDQADKGLSYVDKAGLIIFFGGSIAQAIGIYLA